MPAYLIFDLAEKRKISKTRISFYYFEQGRLYQFNIQIYTDKVNWEDVLINKTSKAEEWSEENFEVIEGRYLKLEILGSR